MIRIARLERRKAHPLVKGFKNVNATSGGMNKFDGESIKQVSPMYLGPINKNVWEMCEGECLLFENYWQYSKIFDEKDREKLSDEYKKWQLKGFASKKGHRHPKGTKTNEVKYVCDKGKNWYVYKCAFSSEYGGVRMGYIESRKKVYTKLYSKLVKETPVFKALKKKVEEGMNIQILDYDAPNESQIVDVELLKRCVNENSPYGKPFGHGYVLAGLLAGIEPDEYCE